MNLADAVLARRGAIANACLGAVLTAVLVLEVANLAAKGRVWWLDWVTGLAVCALALARGRSRLWSAAAGLGISAAAALAAELAGLPGEPGPAAVLALVVLQAAAIRALPARPAVAIAAGGAALTGMMIGFHPDIGIGALGSWLGAAVAAGLLLRLLDVRSQAARESVRRAERLELARELHDVAAHHMTGLVLQAQAARIAARKQPAALDDALADIELAGTGALAAMRRVIGVLRDSTDAAGLSPGPERLEDLIHRFAGSGVPVRLRLTDGPAGPAWPPDVTTTVHRVVQEALTNVIRHARLATDVTVTLAHDRRAVTVEIADDAAPAAPRPFPGAGGYGLTGMRERVTAAGGTFSAGPLPGRGWSVRATVPIGAAAPGGTPSGATGMP